MASSNELKSYRAIEPSSCRARFGFTLIETLVVIAITVMLVGVVLINSSTSRQQLELMVEKARITQLLLRAKSLSISTFAQENLPCGYGLFVNYSSSSYSLINYTTSTCTSIDQIDPSIVSFVPNSTFTLSSNMAFKNGPNQAGYILFLPPNPRVILARPDGTLVTNGTVYIYLKTQQNEFANISVNPLGQVAF